MTIPEASGVSSAFPNSFKNEFWTPVRHVEWLEGTLVVMWHTSLIHKCVNKLTLSQHELF